MNLAGLCEAKLYMRTENVELWEKLDSFNGMLSVQGPPGTGKSSLVWAWSYYQALHSSQKFVWLHYSSIGAANFVILHKKEGKVVRNLSEADYGFNNVLSSIGNCGNCTVIVDGLTEGNSTSKMGPVIMWQGNHEERKAHHILLLLKLKTIITNHIVYSWTYDQYEKACFYPILFSEFKGKLFPVDSSMNTSLQEILKSTTDPSQPLEKIESKGANKDLLEEFKKLLMNEVMYERFYYAGGCARWFFGYNFEKTIRDIKKQVDKIYNMKMYIKDLPGHRNTKTVNHVLACFEDDVFVLVSKYIAHFFSRRCGVSVLKGLLEQDVVNRNPSFTGWIVELHFLMQLRALSKRGGGKLEVFQKDSTMEEWKVKGCTNFEPTTLTALPTTDWLIPEKWQQGGYDFIQVDQESKLLRVVQVTRAAKHPYKLQFVVKLCEKLQELVTLEFLNVVILYPKSSTCPHLSSFFSDLLLKAFKDYHTKDTDWTKDHN